MSKILRLKAIICVGKPIDYLLDFCFTEVFFSIFHQSIVIVCWVVSRYRYDKSNSLSVSPDGKDVHPAIK